MDKMFDLEAQIAEAKLFIKQFLSDGNVRGKVIGTDSFETEDGFYFTVDTCWVNDLQTYETAIKESNMDWIVVDRFDTSTGAEAIHHYWIQKIKNDGVRFFKSQQDGYIYGIVKED